MMLGGNGGEGSGWWGQRRECRKRARDGGRHGGMQARNMFWNINLWFWPWAGALRWKKKKKTLGKPLKSGNVPWISDAGTVEAAMLLKSWGQVRFVFLLIFFCRTAYWHSVHLEGSFFVSPDIHEMNVVQFPNPQSLVKSMKGTLGAAQTIALSHLSEDKLFCELLEGLTTSLTQQPIFDAIPFRWRWKGLKKTSQDRTEPVETVQRV